MSMWRMVETSLAIWALILCLILKACSPAGAAEAPSVPLAVEVRLTHAEIEANLNLLNEAVKSIGLTQPQRLQDALVLLMKFQTALRADAEMRARAPAQDTVPPKKD